jgi:hypothetical protein
VTKLKWCRIQGAPTGKKFALYQRTFTVHQSTYCQLRNVNLTNGQSSWVSTSIISMRIISTGTFEHFYQFTNNPMLTTVHTHQFIQFMSWNNSLFPCWSHTIELYLYKLALTLVADSSQLGVFKLCIGTFEVDIRNIDIWEVGVVCNGTMVVDFWSEHSLDITNPCHTRRYVMRQN